VKQYRNTIGAWEPWGQMHPEENCSGCATARRIYKPSSI